MKEPEAYIIDGDRLEKEDIYTPIQAQEYLQVSDQTVWRWRQSGFLDYVQLAGSNNFVYTKKQLDEALTYKRPNREVEIGVGA